MRRRRADLRDDSFPRFGPTESDDEAPTVAILSQAANAIPMTGGLIGQ
jgi:hypothetical protein